MKVDVISCMLELLQSNKSVALPGLGQWQVDHINSKITGKRIYPPYNSIQFNEKTGSSDSLAQCILEKYKISKKGANQVIQRFSKLLINRLVNYREVHIPRLGTLKSDSKKSLSFQEDQPNVINIAKDYLPSFGLIPIVKEEPIKPQTAVVKSSKSTIVATNQNTSSSTPPVYYEEEKGCFAQFFWPLFWLLLLGLLCIYGIKKCSSLGMDGSVLGKDGEVSTMSDNGKGSKSSDVKEGMGDYDANREYLLSEINEIPDAVFEQGCVIIVGSFRKNSNIIRMKSQLKAEGKDVYTEVIPSGLTRVGFNLDCSRTEVERLINNARKSIDGRAWYLKPKIKINY